ncbi:hypothetical protein MA16_Dca025118 [Dendrobium catenatum]|uniref:Uncharacterized protein n=1 Tax=Dendrobium catenatum TaxID=906689 RepID=A0A2I0WKZ9_9ASPA|nr:hypothetical protein MA16_Dca025118 [Dendrobium catenatum]
MGHIAGQCPNKCLMVMRDDGEVETIEKDDQTKENPSVLLEGEGKFVVQGDLLVAKRALNVQAKETEETQ